MRRSIWVSTLSAAAAVSAAAVIVACQPQSKDVAHRSSEVVSQGEDINLAQGDDRLPTRTASDWVTYADHVVAVTPITEKEIPPPKEDIKHGEGMILRDVTLRVDDVLWSRRGAVKPAPASFDWTAFGWTFSGSTANRTEMAGAGAPRIETGHHYIIAIDWQPARCSPGDSVPAQWNGLGEGAVLPFDDKTLGVGEMEGRHRSVAQARAAADAKDPNYSLEDRMAGKSVGALVTVLEKATPQVRKEFAPPSSKAKCG